MKGGEKMRFGVIILSLLILVAFTGNAFAVGPGKTVEYAGGSAGKVVFDGKAHADKGCKMYGLPHKDLPDEKRRRPHNGRHECWQELRYLP